MRDQLDALRDVLSNPRLLRLQLAWLFSCLGVFGSGLGLTIYAYAAGGPAAVGVMALLLTFPGALAAPALALVIDRLSRRLVLVATTVARAVTVAGVAAAVGAGAPIGVVYALAVVLAVVGPTYRPAMMALQPRVARTPGELSACNLVGSIMSNAGFLLGSVACGVVLSVSSPSVLFGAVAGAYAIAGLALVGIPRDAPPAADAEASPLRELTEGAATIAREPGLREVALVQTVLCVVDGATDVVIVIAALGLLGVGEGGAGALNAAWGIGSLAGAAAVLVLLSRGRLTAGIVAGALAMGAGVAVLGVVPAKVVGVAGLVVFGVGYTLVEVAADTLLQRLVPDHVLGRVGGVLEAASQAGLALGAVGAGVLADVAGTQAALIAIGASFPVVVLLRRRALARLESGAPVAEREYRLLREHPIFAPLSVAETERLAGALEEVATVPGQTVIAEGAHGDRFFLIAEGTFTVEERGVLRREQGPGEGFGEIALLRDVPRTATVRARTPGTLLALDRATFLSAVTGQPVSRQAAHRIAEEFSPATA